MKHALVDDQLILAAADAPTMATCPNCGGRVKLRKRQETYFWRHVQLPRGGCSPQRATALHLTLSAMGFSDALSDDAPRHWKRQVGDLVVELYLDDSSTYGRYLKLRSLKAEASGSVSGVVIPLSEVCSLARTLLELVADLEKIDG